MRMYVSNVDENIISFVEVCPDGFPTSHITPIGKAICLLYKALDLFLVKCAESSHVVCFAHL